MYRYWSSSRKIFGELEVDVLLSRKGTTFAFVVLNRRLPWHATGHAMQAMQSAANVRKMLEGHPALETWASGVLAADEGTLITLILGVLRFLSSLTLGRPPSST